MGGKAAILMVLGFSLIFLIVGHNFGGLSTRSVENMSEYYAQTMAYNIAVSGANLAACEIFQDGSWDSGLKDVPLNQGILNVSVSKTGNLISVLSKGEFNNVEKVVKVTFKPSNFSKFAYYMNLFGGDDELNTGDTIWGPFHTNGKLITKGSPVFYGKATAKLGLKMEVPKDPKFYGGFESGVEVPFAFDTTSIPTAASTGGAYFSPGPLDLRLEFNSDGTVTYNTRPSGESWGTPTTESLSTFAPNGVIWNAKGNLYVSGTVNGKYTIGVGISSGTGSGNVIVEDDLVYRTDPIDDPNCQDMLGIISGNNLVIEDNTANHTDCNIHASILSMKGGLTVEDLNSFPPAGNIYLAGGLIGYQNDGFGVYSSGTLVHGFNLKLKYDERFMVTAPPFFPLTSNFEIVSWFE